MNSRKERPKWILTLIYLTLKIVWYLTNLIGISVHGISQLLSYKVLHTDITAVDESSSVLS